MTRTVLVTGTSGGIGEQIALYLLQQPGVRVIGTARRDAPASLNTNINYQHIKGDLTLKTTVTKIVDVVGASLDGVVFNAGTLDSITKIENTDMESFRKVFDVNYFSVVELTKALIPSLKAAGGRAIYVSSGASVSGYQAWTAYGSSKAALNLMVKTLAKEVPEIVAVSIAPGVVDTDMQVLIRGTTSGEMSESDMSKFLTMKKEGTLVKPQDSGRLYGEAVLKAGKELSGLYLRYDDEKLSFK